MKKCSQCGAELPDSAKFCGSCGGSLIEMPKTDNEQDRLGEELLKPKPELPSPALNRQSKPWLWVVAGVLALGLLAVMAKTCGGDKEEARPDDTVDADTTEYVEKEEKAIAVLFETTQYGKHDENCRLVIDFPKAGNPALVNAIREYVNETLHDNLGGDDYDGDLSDGEQMMKYYFDRESSIEGNNLDAEVKVYNTTDKYVSMCYYIRQYETGYGPGTQMAGGATFRQSDGSMVKWNDFDNNPRMQQLIYEKLLTKTNQAIDDVNPLPKNPPVLYTDEVIFFYTNSELDLPRVNDAPIFAIPFSDIKGLMKPSARELIE